MYTVGTSDRPTAVGRVLPDSTTQLYQATYNSVGNPLTRIDPLGRTTKFTYGNGNDVDLTKVEQKVSATPTWQTIGEWTYNSQHLPLTYTDPAAKVWTYTYNAAGQMLTAKNPLNETTTYNYTTPSGTSISRLTSVVNANAQTAQTLAYPCDATGSVNCELPSVVTDKRVAPDPGTGIEATRAFTRDNLDRVTRIDYPDSTYEQFTYTALDMTQSRDRLGRTTSYGYNDNRMLSSVTDPLSHTVQYGYYRNGALNSLTDQNGNVTSWDIDLNGRVTGKSHAGGTGGWSQTYDSAGRALTRTDALWQTKTFAYNRDNSVASIAYGNEVNATPDVSFVYDTWFPRVKQMTDGFGTTNYGYKPAGYNGTLNLSAVDGPFANDTYSLGYDTASRVNNRTLPEASNANYQEWWYRDAIGRVTGHNTSLGNFTYGYLGETEQVASRGVTNGGVTLTTAWGYGTNAQDRRLAGITHSHGARSYTYTSNPERITAIAETAGGGSASWGAQSWSFGYDNADRLTSASTGSPTSWNFAYGYDDADNITSLTRNPGGGGTFTYNAANQRNGLPTYDANGNVTDDYYKYRFSYDAENRLIRAEYKTAAGASTYTGQETKWEYDGLGRRTKEINIPAGGGSSSSTYFLWCGDEMCQRRDGSNNAIKRYYPEGENNLSTGAKSVTQQDHLGSIRDAVLTDGTLTFSIDYDPYGRVLRHNVPTGNWPDFRWAGLMNRGSFNRYMATHRVFDPDAIRWNTRDPIAEQGGINLYGYVGQEPIGYMDPTGLDRQYTVTVGGTLAKTPIGLGGSFWIGVSIPDDWTDLGNYQGIVTGQTNVMVGGGAYMGWGLSAGVSRSDGPLPPGLSGGAYWYSEANVGLGVSTGDERPGIRRCRQ